AAYHYWAPSDWLRDVHPNDVYIGGNLLGVARVYRKDKVATVSGNTGVSKGYIIAIPESEDIINYFLDIDVPQWERPTTYPPATPSVKVATVEGLLDYYLRYEQYKIEYNEFVKAVDDGSYETKWNDYDGYKWSLRLPPLVAYSNGSYTLTNVPYGQYKFYFVVDSDMPYGTLPDVKVMGPGTTVPVYGNATYP
ncbi:MAG: hypothetical protein KA407_06260, partial [Spirochaetes bacterium]|nr:hypothetical protein [Spirochaetota bacterium]